MAIKELDDLPTKGLESRRELDPNWRNKPMLKMWEASLVTTLGTTATYEAVRRGDIPSRRIGRRIMVPTAELRKWLGELSGGE